MFRVIVRRSTLVQNGGERYYTRMKTYKPTIGIEVHAELKTQTKMFCDSKNEPHASEPNVHVCPICMGHPGTLPVINRTAVEHVLKVGLALGSELATYTEFDRKNYFYPDIPKGYQISQYEYPLVKGGSLNNVAITRVHLEEDTARSLHDQGEGSIIDYNRAGVPLMELVTEPVIHDAKTAGDFARELQLLLRTLGVSDANMEKGEMRVEANISISDTDTFGTKVEVKNLNSFKAVENAIEYEIKRQAELLDKGEKVVQETRGWNEAKGKTFSQRVKESANDYRYFPDPDLPKLNLSLEIPASTTHSIESKGGVSDEKNLISRLADAMPILPSKKREIYSNLGLSRDQIEIIISDRPLDEFFNAVLKITDGDTKKAKLAANYMLTDMLPLLEKNSLAQGNVTTFAALVTMVNDGLITSRVAKDMLEEVVFKGSDPLKTAEEKGLLQNNSAESLNELVQMIVAGHPQVVAEFKAGKEASLQFLVGQGMKLSKGSANPKVLADVLKSSILG